MLKNFFSQDLKEGEEVVEIIRKHWGSFIISSIKILVAFFIPFFLLPFFSNSFRGLLVFFVLFLIALGYAIHLWISWYNDLFIITNQRLININQKSVISKEVSEIGLADIQGVTYEVAGILAMMFNYGSVKIQATGIKDLIEIREAPVPKDLQEKIVGLKKKTSEGNKVSACDLVELMGKIKSEKISGMKGEVENALRGNGDKKAFKSKEIKS